MIGFCDAQGKSQKLQTSHQAAAPCPTWTLNMLATETAWNQRLKTPYQHLNQVVMSLLHMRGGDLECDKVGGGGEGEIWGRDVGGEEEEGQVRKGGVWGAEGGVWREAEGV